MTGNGSPGEDITGILRRWSAGDPDALDQLIPIVYDHLGRLAHQRLRQEPGCSLGTTGLVHEAYLRLAAASDPGVTDRAQFLALASHVMRNVLVDQARARKAAKRGGGAAPVSLTPSLDLIPDRELERYADVDEALKRLEQMDPRQSLILEQRYFGGLSLAETAAAVSVSVATVKRELRSAHAWLALQLDAAVPEGDA